MKHLVILSCQITSLMTPAHTHKTWEYPYKAELENTLRDHLNQASYADDYNTGDLQVGPKQVQEKQSMIYIKLSQ